MKEKNTGKAFSIQAYFDNLEQRIVFLENLNESGHKDEALMLCCCYIEAFGSRQYPESEQKAKNYSTVLKEYGGNEIFALVHPKQLKRVLATQSLFKGNLLQVESIIQGFGKELVLQEMLLNRLAPIITKDQANWLQHNMFKATIAAISYELVRCQLVHDISASNVTSEETTFQGHPVPDLNFKLLYPALLNIFHYIKERSLSTNSWYWKQ